MQDGYQTFQSHDERMMNLAHVGTMSDNCSMPIGHLTYPVQDRNSLNPFVSLDFALINFQGINMQDNNTENLKPPSYQVPLAGNCAALGKEAQSFLHGQDRFLPIANIFRIMKNTLHPPKEKRQDSKRQN